MGTETGTFMRGTDALTWNMERDPELRATVLIVAWLGARPDAEVVAGRLERATRLAPRFRQRPVQPGRLSTPRWVDCPFDLSLHLRRMGAPAPRSEATVLAFARSEAMTAFDPTRPLWQFTLIEGLEGDRAALVMKIHHVLTDGIGGVQLAELLFDTTAEPPPLDPVPEPAPEPEPSGLGLVLDALGHTLGRGLSVVGDGLAGAVPAARGATRHPLRTTVDLSATIGSLGRFVRPVSETLSPLMTARSLGRHLDVLDVDLADLKRAGASVGATLNAAFIASLTGGLRRYHELHGVPVEELRLTMPISLRRPDDPIGGNRFTLERFTVPVAEADAATRVRMTCWLCKAAQREEALPLSDPIAGALNLLPPGVVGAMLKHVDFLASDVPGVPVGLFLCGAPVTACHAFGPTSGASFNATLLSYRETCHVGITVDTAAVPDPDELMACLHGGFDEVLALGGTHRAVLRSEAPDRRAG